MFKFVNAQFQKLLKPLIGQPQRRADRNRTAALIENLESRCLLTANLLQAPLDVAPVSIETAAAKPHSHKPAPVPNFAGTYQFSAQSLHVSGTLITTQSGKTATIKLTVGSASITTTGKISNSGHLTGTLKNIHALVSEVPANISAKFDATPLTSSQVHVTLTVGSGKHAHNFDFTATKSVPTTVSSFDGHYSGFLNGSVVDSQNNSTDLSNEVLDFSVVNGVISTNFTGELAFGSGTLTAQGNVSFTTVDSARGFSLQYTGTLHAGDGTVSGSGTWTVISAQSPGMSGSGTWNLYRDAAVVVSIQVTDPSAAEGPPANPGVFTITRSGPTTAPLTVDFYTSGDAVAGVDYTDPGFSVVIPAGSSTTTVTINPLTDDFVSNDEQATLTLTAGENYGVNPTAASATVTIANTPPTGGGVTQFNGDYTGTFSGDLTAFGSSDTIPGLLLSDNTLNISISNGVVTISLPGIPATGTGSINDQGTLTFDGIGDLGGISLDVSYTGGIDLLNPVNGHAGQGTWTITNAPGISGSGTWVLDGPV
ncbi:MAG: hypothetical protein JWM11_3396 [Planctomycetaceae bacterium]|nr:hypothetical protein [Planctomycetaceae bacterium]